MLAGPASSTRWPTVNPGYPVVVFFLIPFGILCGTADVWGGEGGAGYEEATRVPDALAVFGVIYICIIAFTAVTYIILCSPNDAH